MTKQEHIEEMISAMTASNNPFVDVPIDIMPKVAEALYNAGYRKINDDCAVITKAELNQYKAQAVREFAEKLKNGCAYSFIFGQKFTTERRIDELLKEYEK